MALYHVKTDLIQKIGQNFYKFNFTSLASNISIQDNSGQDSTVQKEIEALRSAVSDVTGTVSDSADIYIKDDIAARNAIDSPNAGSLCYVVDASSDSSVGSGAATYIYNGSAWVNIHNIPQVLKDLSDTDGVLTYKGKKVGMDNGGTFNVKVTGANPDYNTALAALGDIPDKSVIAVFREEPVLQS